MIVASAIITWALQHFVLSLSLANSTENFLGNRHLSGLSFLSLEFMLPFMHKKIKNH